MPSNNVELNDWEISQLRIAVASSLSVASSNGDLELVSKLQTLLDKLLKIGAAPSTPACGGVGE